MGHIVKPNRAYRLLQRKLDRTVTGAPDSPILMQILSLLFSPEDADLARRIPGRLTTAEKLSARLDIPRDELLAKLSDMAERGLIIDLEHKGRRWFALAPVAIGFFEFTFMRTRGEVPQAELARLFEQYMHQDDRFARSVLRGPTQIGRTLVREEALPAEDHTEILDWERASRVVESAGALGVSLCACRHKANHLGEACERPQHTCLSLNYAAESLIRNGMAEPLSTGEAVALLGQCKEVGLAQTGDNVQRTLTYICNCCGCCCELMRSVKTFDIRGAIVTSNWIMEVDTSKCTGCGQCVEACPVDAIELAMRNDDGKPREQAACNKTLCLGCGVCYSSCTSAAIAMKSRDKRVFTPESVFDRMIMMAIERGRLADLIFDDPDRFGHLALGRIVATLEKIGAFKATVAIRPLRSAFLRRLVTAAKKELGDVLD